MVRPGTPSARWPESAVSIRIEETGGGNTAIVAIDTPVGILEVIAELEQVGRSLYIRRAHVQGLSPGMLGRAGLNAVGDAILREADVDLVVIEGGPRSAGRGRRPKPIRYPR